MVVICGDGWAHIFYSPRSVNPSIINATSTQQLIKETNDQDNIKHGESKIVSRLERIIVRILLNEHHRSCKHGYRNSC